MPNFFNSIFNYSNKPTKLLQVLVLVVIACVAGIECGVNEDHIRQERGLLPNPLAFIGNFLFPVQELTTTTSTTQRPEPQYAQSHPSRPYTSRPTRPYPPPPAYNAGSPSQRQYSEQDRPYPPPTYNAGSPTQRPYSRPPYLGKPEGPYSNGVGMGAAYSAYGVKDDYATPVNYNNYPEAEEKIRPVTIHVKIPAPPAVPGKVGKKENNLLENKQGDDERTDDGEVQGEDTL